MLIIKEENREIIENSTKRIINYLNRNHFKDASTRLISFSEVCINQTDKIIYNQTEDQNIIIIPLVGNFVFDDIMVKSNEILFHQLSKNDHYTLHQSDLDFGYAIIIKTEKISDANFIDNIKIGNNNLNTILNVADYLQIKVGIYSLRTKDCLKYNENKNFIAFVLAGAFELNDRLLEAKEMLVTENENKLDFEALSDQALLLIIELKTN